MNSINQNGNVREFFFHPLSVNHSAVKKVISIIVCIALSIFTAGIYLAVFIGVNTSDNKKADLNQTRNIQIINKPKYNIAQGYEDRIPSNEFTREELAKHNTPRDIWIAISDLVFNVTRFLDDHPGGEDVLLSVAGTDATQKFADIGHTPEACRQAMMKWCIGRLV